MFNLTETVYFCVFQNNVEPMVIDMAVEENDNTEEEPVIVESTSLVGVALMTLCCYVYLMHKYMY